MSVRRKRAQTAREVPQSFYQWWGDMQASCAQGPVCAMQDMRFLPGSQSKALPHVAAACGFTASTPMGAAGRGPPIPFPMKRECWGARVPIQAGIWRGLGNAGCGGVSCTALGCWQAGSSSCSGGARVQSTPSSALHTAPAAQPAISQGAGRPPPCTLEPGAQHLQAESGGRLFHCSAQHPQGFKRQGRDRGAAVVRLALKGWDRKERSRGQSPDLWGPKEPLQPGPPQPPQLLPGPGARQGHRHRPGPAGRQGLQHRPEGAAHRCPTCP